MEEYPQAGELLLDAVSKLTERQREQLNYTGICSLIAQEIAARAIHQSIHELSEHQEELED